MREDVAAFINYRFEKISRLNDESKTNEVWHVKVRATGQFAVMKIIKSGNVPCAELRDMANPILAKILYCAQDESDTVIVEEYVAGETLSEILRGGKFFDETAAQDFLLQMCDGLKILHAAGIVHRDIKPSNLIRQSDGRIKLIDFDAARIFKADKRRDTRHLGTEGYAPPEQYGAGQTDNRSDIYALGVTAKEMLGKNYRGRLEKILAKCTAYDPQYRYQSVDELKAALTSDEVEKKSYGGKIFLICAAIILSAVIFYFNSPIEEKIPAEIPLQEEKISVQEKPVENVTEVKPAPKVDEKVTFGEIVLPELATPSNSTSQNLPQLATPSSSPPQSLPQLSTPPISTPQSTPQLSTPITLPPMTSNNTSTPPAQIDSPQVEDVVPAENFVRAKYFLNGEHINAWQDNSSEDSEVAHLVHIPFETWHNNFYPITGTLEIQLKNLSAKSFAPQLEITFDDNGIVDTKILNGTLLAHGQSFTFTVPLNQFRVESLKDALVGSAELNIKILGAAQIIGSTAIINFVFVHKNFPIIED